MRLLPRLPHHLPQRHQQLRRDAGRRRRQQARAPRLRELSPRVPQVALQAHQVLHSVPGVGGVPADEELTHHPDQGHSPLPAPHRLLLGTREARREDQSEREGPQAGHRNAGHGLPRPAQGAQSPNGGRVQVPSQRAGESDGHSGSCRQARVRLRVLVGSLRVQVGRQAELGQIAGLQAANQPGLQHNHCPEVRGK